MKQIRFFDFMTGIVGGVVLGIGILSTILNYLDVWPSVVGVICIIGLVIFISLLMYSNKIDQEEK